MKKLIPVLCMLALCLCACSGEGTPTQPVETVAPTTEAATGPVNALDLPLHEAYDRLLQDVIDAFPNVSSLDQYPELSHMYDGHNSLTELGWAVADLDGDGSAELLIKSLESPFIYDAFTVKDGVLTDLFTSTENDSFRLYEEGYVEAQWSAGAAMGTDYYRIEQGTLVLFDRVVQDPEQAAALGLIQDTAQPDTTACWFRSETGDKADYVSVTAIEAMGIQQSFKEEHFELYPTFAPLSDYKK